MTQEEKQLVFKVLCEQLPYGLYVQTKSSSIPIELRYLTLDSIPNVKPYLRPMASMTDEEVKELVSLGKASLSSLESGRSIEIANSKQMDWLNSHHFDHRGLIPMGLALELPFEGMYQF